MATRKKISADVLVCGGGCAGLKTRPLMPLTLHFRIGNVKRNSGLSTATRQALVRAQKTENCLCFTGRA